MEHLATNFEIAIIVCTRNRAASLAKALASISLAAKFATDVKLQVILVDNGSSDDSSHVIREWSANQSFKVDTIYEGRPGVSCARNAGLARVASRVVAMTDDDCQLRQDYLSALAAAFRSQHVDAVVGGRIILGDHTDLPITIKDIPIPLTLSPDRFPAGFIMGANMAFPSSLVRKVGLFDERFGAGGKFLAAEDTDFYLRAMAMGITVKYDPSFVVEHHHGRKEKIEAIKLASGYYYADGALYAKYLLSNYRIRREIIRDLKRVVRELRYPKRNVSETYFSGLFKVRYKIIGFINFMLSSVLDRIADLVFRHNI